MTPNQPAEYEVWAYAWDRSQDDDNEDSAVIGDLRQGQTFPSFADAAQAKAAADATYATGKWETVEVFEISSGRGKPPVYRIGGVLPYREIWSR